MDSATSASTTKSSAAARSGAAGIEAAAMTGVTEASGRATRGAATESSVLPKLAWGDLARAYAAVAGRLQAEQNGAGHWVGRLSTSALSTATAVSALAVVRARYGLPTSMSGHPSCLAEVDEAIETGCEWLLSHQLADGGFGDTDRSHSNIATSLLVLAAWKLAGFDRSQTAAVEKCEQYVERAGGWDGLKRRYGKDKTFVVPILSNCAIAGMVPWSQVPALPFEAAWLPQDFYRFARMPVVSYAVPALVAIGQATFLKSPPRSALLRKLRRRALEPTLQVLRNMQPASGGYLEAVPLTSFVLMNLAVVGNASTPVATDCLRFLLDSRLEDGSWPIDTNLATWVSSLSIQALHQAPKTLRAEPRAPVEKTLRWLLSCQHRRRHPFTGANPGGWGWSDLSGAVPDADDTPAALLASHVIFENQALPVRLEHQLYDAVAGGLRWLVDLQNRDGGWPTFCRGWGQLPFDRSGTDLTAHAIRALQTWLPHYERLLSHADVRSRLPTVQSLEKACQRGFAYLHRQQQADGSWLPLWFGNQDREQEDNPVYGTGKVLMAFATCGTTHAPAARAGLAYLRSQQNADGGWGGGKLSYEALRLCNSPDSLAEAPILAAEHHAVESSTIEETAIALEGLLACGGDPRADETIMRGLRFLVDAVGRQHDDIAWPIGFYFAKLWYYEDLYPRVFATSALGRALASWQASELGGNS